MQWLGCQRWKVIGVVHIHLSGAIFDHPIFYGEKTTGTRLVIEMQFILTMAPLFSVYLCAYLGHAAAVLMVHTRSFVSKFVSLISTSYGLLSILKVAYLWWKISRYGLGYLGPQAIGHCLGFSTSQNNETTTHPIILLGAQPGLVQLWSVQLNTIYSAVHSDVLKVFLKTLIELNHKCPIQKLEYR